MQIAKLKQRSQLLRTVRQFFYDHDFLEVETPLLASEVIPEQHIEPSRVATQRKENQSQLKTPLALRGNAATSYLQASPELHMKRLVAAGMGKIFQITRSFRAGERGPLHNPEFTILEWYRVGDDMRAGMGLLDELCQTTLKTHSAQRTSYATAFQRYANICPHTATVQELADCAKKLNLTVPADRKKADRDEWLNLLLALQIEPQLGREGPEILYDYPASQAALAKVVTREDGKRVAERFELYYQGVELANGYHELTDAAELKSRLEEVNRLREIDDRQTLPMPESLLSAMEAGLPACAGCALGFDRLVMLALGAKSIREVSIGEVSTEEVNDELA
ncbi:MAG: EF-P lysine aminoacylase GenX [Planctomycetes bacterium]|nr:EF-P lysine aminoacylase GenX [Planctomycetota bacterium]